MPSKKEEIVSVFICNCKAEEAEKSFSSDWAENLAESNQGFLLSPHQHLVQGDQKFPKITVEEPLEDLESENIAPWQKLQQEANKSVTCSFCQGSVELVENVRTWFHLDVSVPERRLSVARN